MSWLFSDKSRFFRAYCISGAPADLGFACEICHQVIRYGLQPGQTVEHCDGKRDPVPDISKWHDLPAKSLRRGMPDLPKGFMVVDTWDEIGGWDEESASKSDDPSAYEVGWV